MSSHVYSGLCTLDAVQFNAMQSENEPKNKSNKLTSLFSVFITWREPPGFGYMQLLSFFLGCGSSSWAFSFLLVITAFSSKKSMKSPNDVSFFVIACTQNICMQSLVQFSLYIFSLSLKYERIKLY